MNDLLLPRTAAATVNLGALLATRRSPEFRRLTIGLATITAAFFALRTLR